MQVKILGISGSPRKAATQFVVQEALRAAGEIPGVETEFIDLRGKEIHHCIHCDRCIKEQADHCPAFKDDMYPLYAKLLQADGFIFGSPVYQMSPTALMQAFLNRFRPLGRYISKGHWATKVGGALAVGGTRHGGQETTLESINNFFFCNGMVVVSGGIFAYNGGSVWSNDKKEEGARSDELGLSTARVIGRRVAVTAKLLKAGLSNFMGTIDPGQLVGLRDRQELKIKSTNSDIVRVKLRVSIAEVDENGKKYGRRPGLDSLSCDYQVILMIPYLMVMSTLAGVVGKVESPPWWANLI